MSNPARAGSGKRRAWKVWALFAKNAYLLDVGVTKKSLLRHWGGVDTAMGEYIERCTIRVSRVRR